MGNPVKTEPCMNAAAFIAWYDLQPDGERYELLDGRVYPMFTTEMQGERVIHAETKARITESFRSQIRAKRLECQALGDGMAVWVDEDTVFEPDALVRCGPRLPDGTLVIMDVMIVVEVASPAIQSIDALHKLTLYFRNSRIVHYLIVLPARKIVIHHQRGADGQITAAICGKDSLVLDPPGLTLNVDELFDDSNL